MCEVESTGRRSHVSASTTCVTCQVQQSERGFLLDNLLVRIHLIIQISHVGAAREIVCANYIQLLGGREGVWFFRISIENKHCSVSTSRFEVRVRASRASISALVHSDEARV